MARTPWIITWLALAAAAPPTAHAQATAWGYLGGAHPQFSVVYVEGPAVRAESVTLKIRDARFEPSHAAIGVGGTIAVLNASRETHTLVNPFDEIIRQLRPGETLKIEVAKHGARSFFLLGARGGAEATVFVSPGPYSVVKSGRFELTNLRGGKLKLHAWRPDAPSVFTWIRLQPRGAQRFDIRR